MKSYNIWSISICLLIIIVTFLTFNDTEPSMGKAILFIYFMYPIFGISIIMLIITLIIAITGKKLFDGLTILNIGVICLTGTSPLWLI